MATSSVGTRVVRGPDWHFLNDDGGDGCVGTVVEVRAGNTTTGSSKPTAVANAGEATSATCVVHVVQWDSGKCDEYPSCGVAGNRVLRILDTTTAGRFTNGGKKYIHSSAGSWHQN